MKILVLAGGADQIALIQQSKNNAKPIHPRNTDLSIYDQGSPVRKLKPDMVSPFKSK